MGEREMRARIRPVGAGERAEEIEVLVVRRAVALRAAYLGLDGLGLRREGEAFERGRPRITSAHARHGGVHEAGAIERTGHKVLPLPSHDGRIALEDLRRPGVGEVSKKMTTTTTPSGSAVTGDEPAAIR